MDKFRRMEIFVAIVEAGQLTRAANNLHLSKSAVSQSLTDLEDYLDTQLIMRKNGAWQLSEAGSTYYNKSKKILAAIDAYDDDAQQGRQNLSGLIRISAPSTFGSYLLTPIISKFMEIHPNIVIELNQLGVITDLIEERVDIAFRSTLGKERCSKNNKLEIHKIGETEMVICSSPAYLKTYGTPKTHLDLKKHRCILYTRAPTWTLSKNGRNFEHTPTGPIIIDNAEIKRELCIHGQGLSFMAAKLAAGPMKKGKLVPILEDYDCGTVQIQAVRIKDKYTPARVIQLLNFIIDELRGYSGDMFKLV